MTRALMLMLAVGGSTAMGQPTISEQPDPVVVVPSGGGRVTLEVSAAGGPGLSYRWFKDGVSFADGTRPDGGLVSGSSGPTLVLDVRQQDQGEYVCRVADANGTVATAPVEVVVRAPRDPADQNGDGSVDFFDVVSLLNVLSPAVPPLFDADNDGLNAEDELFIGTDPENPDSDGDGLADGYEVDVTGTDPVSSDSDGDAVRDGDEVLQYGTDPKRADTDNDGWNDGHEVFVTLTDPTLRDTDGDSVKDSSDPDPFNPEPDSDFDGIPDFLDECPDDSLNWCNLPDRDNDGIPDVHDPCPWGAWCENQPIDSDLDGVPDVNDPCPSDPTDACVWCPNPWEPCFVP